ncbi:MAG TPA: sigma-70 family RNA polymerase sigma factor [Pyrinomonadaceae bacterium]
MRIRLSPERELSDAREVALLRAVAGGDQKAFAQLYDAYSSILFGLLLRILHSRPEAEDVLQEVFLQVWQQASNYKAERGRPFTWLVTLARSRAIDRLRLNESRERTANVVATSVDATDEAADAVEETFRSEQSDIVRRALEAIPEDQRRTLLLAYFGGLTQTEIADELREPLGTIKTRMRSGMRKLRELLSEKARDMLPGM